MLLGREQPYVLACDHCLVGELLEQSFVHARDRSRAWAYVVAGNEMQQLAVETEHVREQTAAERDRVSHDCLEHRLHVGRRGADYAKNLRGRSLLLQRLGESLPGLSEFAGPDFE